MPCAWRSAARSEKIEKKDEKIKTQKWSPKAKNKSMKREEVEEL